MLGYLPTRPRPRCEGENLGLTRYSSIIASFMVIPAFSYGQLLSQADISQSIGRYHSRRVTVEELKASGLLETDISSFLDANPQHPLRFTALDLLLAYRTPLAIELMIDQWAHTNDRAEPSYIFLLLSNLFKTESGALFALETKLSSPFYLREQVVDRLIASKDRNRIQSARLIGFMLVSIDTEDCVDLLRVILRGVTWVASDVAELYRRIGTMTAPTAKGLIEEERLRLMTMLEGIGTP